MKKIFIRLLTGQLIGCEFELLTSRTLIVAGKQPPGDDSEFVTLPADTLYIPMEQQGVNFELLQSEDKVIARELRETGITERELLYNIPIDIGDLVFALRDEEMVWSAGILGYSKSKSDSAETLFPVRNKFKRKYFIPLFLILLLVLLTPATYYVASEWRNPQKQIKSLESLLVNNKHNLLIKNGSDNVIYVISQSSADSLWAQQVIARDHYNKPYKVVYSASEDQRVTQWLAENYPSLAYFQLQLVNPLHPQLWISQQRSGMDIKSMKILSNKLQHIMPYADKVEVLLMDDNIAMKQAEDILLRLGLPYYSKRDHNVVAYFIHGNLADDQLLRTWQLVNNYYQQWGKRYVQFSVELKNDAFTNYSSTSGDEDYIKISQNHWYFSEKR